VDFRLPNIVQCDSEKTADLIRALGICGQHTSFREQLRNRFIISMDGNGATCSRVAITLKSNSVLLKYDSPHILYYFSQLIPWLHYIPVSRDEDVNAILDIERAHPGYFQMIAEESAAFYNRLLCRASILAYGADLISMYADIVAVTAHIRAEDGDEIQGTEISHSPNGCIDLDLMVHIGNVGDTWTKDGPWIGTRGSGKPIEGFALRPSDAYLFQYLEYRAYQRDFSVTPWCHSGEFCGSRGSHSPIYGIGLRIGGPRAHLYECRYSGICVDGTMTSPSPDGEGCLGDTSSPIEALEIVITRKIND
jgi:hypothetical protein